jgi:hypothetical protein
MSLEFLNNAANKAHGGLVAETVELQLAIQESGEG